MNPAEMPVLTAQRTLPANPGFTRFNPGRSFAAVLVMAVVAWSSPALHSQTQTYTFSTLAGIGGKSGVLNGAGGGIGFPLFAAPTGLVVNKNGNLYVTDSGNQLIREVTPAGAVSTVAGTVGQSGILDGTGISAGFNSPQGPAVDAAGNLYVADYNSATIRKITPAGVVTTFAGLALTTGVTDGTGTAARFNKPSGVAVDSSGNVYVADSGNHTIRKITSAGVVTTLAGSATVSGNTDGTGTAAFFNNPRSVVVDSAGNLYVADTNNNAIRMVTSAGVVKLFVGQAGTYGYTDGVGTAARFSFPNSLALDSAGNLYVADELNHVIRKVTSTGTVSTFAGLAGTSGSVDGTGSAARFSSPTGVAVDGSGNVYVTDYANFLIRKISSSGVVTTVAGVVGMAGALDGLGYNLTPALFSSPSATAVDTLGNVYVADTANNLIRRIDATGVVSTLAGNSSALGRLDGTGTGASFNAPSGVATAPNGNVYVADTANHLIRLVTASGIVTTFAGTGGTAGNVDGLGTAASFNLPSAVAVDAGYNVYVADYGNNTIRKIAPGGAVTTLAGIAGSAGSKDGVGNAATFNHPRGIAVDGAGYVYVSDSGNHTIRKVSPAGFVQTLAGTAGTSGSADSAGATSARFNTPGGLAVDGAGNVYVTDTNNSTIRQITAAGVVSTVGGSAGGASNVDGVGTVARFDHPAGIAADTTGTIYIADTRNHTIRKGTTPTSSGGGGSGGSGSGGSTTGGTGGSTSSGGTGGNGGTGGTGGTSGTGAGFFLHPSALALSPSGALYVADTANNCIKTIASDGTVTIFAGKDGAAGSADGTGTAALFNGPIGMIADSASNLYICDTGNATIRKITSAGVVTTIAGSPGSRGSQDGTGSAALFSTPTGIVMDALGNLLVTDATNCTIRKITSAGVVTTIAGTAKSSGDADGVGAIARFNNPTGVAINTNTGVLYVADTYNNTIRKINTANTSATALATGTITASGNVIVVVTDPALTGSPITVTVPVLVDDLPSAWIVKVATALQANTVITARYSVVASGVAIVLTSIANDSNAAAPNVSLANGSTPVGITDAPTSTPFFTGVVATVAGSAGVSGAFDGTGTYALFNLPYSVSYDTSTGSIYVADTGNSCIRRVYASGLVTTIAGIAGISGNRDGTNTTALFNQPQAVLFSSSILVADTGNSVLRGINSQGIVSTVNLKASTTTTTPSTGTTTPSTSSGGGGSVEPWFAAALFALAGLAFFARRNPRFT